MEFEQLMVRNKELEDHVRKLNHKISKLNDFIISSVILKGTTPEPYHEETELKEPLGNLGCLHESSSEDDGIFGTTSTSIDLLGFE